MRYLLGFCLLTFAACSTMTPENTRNEDLLRAARACETGSLTVTGISPDGTPNTRTVSSSGSERPVFEKCYAEKSAPIWKAFCSNTPGASGCAGR